MTEPRRDHPHLPAGGADARLLAEAVRLLEESRAAVFDAPAADAAARAGGGDFEARVCARAAALPVAAEVRAGIARVRSAVRLALAIALALGAVAGATTARVALDASPVNVYWALLSLLGVHILALLGWLVLAAARPGAAASGVIGGAVLALGRRLAGAARRGAADTAAARAATAMLTDGGIARWALGGVSHAVWLAFLAAALAVLGIRLATLDFIFVWETTILGPADYVALTGALAAAPDALGFPTPTVAEIAASRRTGLTAPAAMARAAWSGFIVGSVVVYGLVPRAAALIVCLIGWQRARRRWRLDTAHLGYAVLRPRLMPESRSVGIVDAAPPPEPDVAAPAPAAAPDAPVFGGTGAIAIVGLEIEPPAGGWPPRVPGVAWQDLGLADDRAGRQRAMDTARATLPPPRGVLVVCDLAATPDRGTGRWLAGVAEAIAAPVAVLLTGGERLRLRTPAPHVAQRIADWRGLAANAGLPAHRVIEADLDHLTDAAGQRLAERLGAGGERPAQEGPPLAAVFERIVEHANRWAGPPSDRERADLQAAIARLYQHSRPGWAARFGMADVAEPPTLDTLRTGAERLLDLLPARLRADPRWLSAGAAAGALGCIATAMLAAPAALAALPTWAGLGAVVGLVLSGNAPERPKEAPDRDIGEAVAAAALFALVLHLQGRDEAAITRLLDRALPDPTPPVLPDAAAAAAWLHGVRERLDAALAGEPAPWGADA